MERALGQPRLRRPQTLRLLLPALRPRLHTTAPRVTRVTAQRRHVSQRSAAGLLLFVLAAAEQKIQEQTAEISRLRRVAGAAQGDGIARLQAA